VSPLGAPRARGARSRLWSDRRDFGTHAAQTRALYRASVSAEGGGTVTPTLGGGFGFTRARELLTPPPAAVARA
jgi:hypothetical protein